MVAVGWLEYLHTTYLSMMYVRVPSYRMYLPSSIDAPEPINDVGIRNGVGAWLETDARTYGGKIFSPSQRTNTTINIDQPSSPWYDHAHHA